MIVRICKQGGCPPEAGYNLPAIQRDLRMSEPSMKQILSEIDAAAHRLYPHVRKTWLEYSPHFSELTGAKVWLKLENLQRTGSFKVRGAFNKLLSLEAHELARGCVTASSGNHGAASAYAMAKLGVKGLIFVPQTTSSSKLAAIHRYGGEVRLFGRESGESEGEARRYAAENGMTYISPYNDLAVLAGQERRPAERLKADRTKHPLATRANVIFLTLCGVVAGLAVIALFQMLSVSLLQEVGIVVNG